MLRDEAVDLTYCVVARASHGTANRVRCNTTEAIHARDIVRRRQRRAGIGFRVSLSLFCGLAVIWVASSKYRVELECQYIGLVLECESGAFHVCVARDDGMVSAVQQFQRESSGPVDHCAFYVSRIVEKEQAWLRPILFRRRGLGMSTLSRSGLGVCVEYSPAIWPLMTALALVAGYFAWTARRARLRAMRIDGECVVCGFDLLDNVSGVCPECGTPFREKHEIRL